MKTLFATLLLGAVACSNANPAATATYAPISDPANRKCEGTFTTRADGLSFECPRDWLVWEESYRSDATSIIIANHQATANGGDGLPEEWFKVDMQAEHNSTESMSSLSTACKTGPADNGATVTSCTSITINGREWAREEQSSPDGGSITLQTVSSSELYRVVGLLTNGSARAAGVQTIEALFRTLEIR